LIAIEDATSDCLESRTGRLRIVDEAQPIKVFGARLQTEQRGASTAERQDMKRKKIPQRDRDRARPNRSDELLDGWRF
jgi:hypothetical protein